MKNRYNLKQLLGQAKKHKKEIGAALGTIAFIVTAECAVSTKAQASALMPDLKAMTNLGIGLSANAGIFSQTGEFFIENGKSETKIVKIKPELKTQRTAAAEMGDSEEEGLYPMFDFPEGDAPNPSLNPIEQKIVEMLEAYDPENDSLYLFCKKHFDEEMEAEYGTLDNFAKEVKKIEELGIKVAESTQSERSVGNAFDVEDVRNFIASNLKNEYKISDSNDIKNIVNSVEVASEILDDSLPKDIKMLLIAGWYATESSGNMEAHGDKTRGHSYGLTQIQIQTLKDIFKTAEKTEIDSEEALAVMEDYKENKENKKYLIERLKEPEFNLVTGALNINRFDYKLKNKNSWKKNEGKYINIANKLIDEALEEISREEGINASTMRIFTQQKDALVWFMLRGAGHNGGSIAWNTRVKKRNGEEPYAKTLAKNYIRALSKMTKNELDLMLVEETVAKKKRGRTI